MIFYALSAFSVAAFAPCVAEELVLPVATCKRTSADYSTCLKRAIEESWPRFITGLPEFDFPPLDPMLYEYGKYILDKGFVHAEVIVSNVIGDGLKETQFLDVRTHFLDDIFRLEIDTQIPRVFLSGNINAKGSLGGFRLHSKGHFNLSIKSMSTTWNMIGHVTNDTWVIESFRNSPSLEKFKLQYKDVFESNKDLDDLAVAFVNEYWPALLRAILPTLTETWGPWLADIGNRLFSKVSFSKLFPED